MNKHKRCIFPGALCTKSKKARCLKKFQIIISIFNILKKLIEKRELMDKHQKQKEDRLNQQFKIWATPCISFLYFRLLSTVS